jgi:uncharacterized protein (TIGR02145 family)
LRNIVLKVIFMVTQNKILRITGILLIIILSLSCKKNEVPVTLPDVVTTPVSSVLYETAASGGIVADDGGASVIVRGVCWGTNSNPTISNYITTDGGGTGVFSSSVTGLAFGTKYYLRAYASNSSGTAYGNELVFTTKVAGVTFNPSLTYGTVTDIGGISYKTIPIGQQVWMAENLKTSRLNDGTTIPLVVSNSEWTNIQTPAYCWFDNNKEVYENIYGAYYNWYAVSTGKLCPAGWHVPSDAEWQQLVNFLGGNAVAGSKIKEAGTNNWSQSNKDATNSSGFTALPSGLRGSQDGLFDGQGTYGGWWSTTENNPSPLGAVWSRWIRGDTTLVLRGEIFKIDGFNVRCLKDQ